VSVGGEGISPDGEAIDDRVVAYALDAIGRAARDAISTTVLADALLQRSGDGDLEDAQAAIDRLAAEATEPGFVLNEITLLRLRALVARARGDEATYRDFADRYRDIASSLGFEGHMKWAEAMA
jgi:adenylate cyclase